ncbi:High-affinity nicotinic acid transporter [Exophiala xenobiotica]|uniref:High-affinity nicotinic acid transporter n=1 Tax=Vermiconidia calcicola TaxID=1690605 RepID=A0AAV9QFZ6_9PEZI|nr:High-affinity nicotinic acid transporter [Exophiala xenobiotica]KAK5537164.1 High-affinity nicotinic acid transporter [Chaetothyriales sp. CCFEE 6169]KAK5542098.1 High-affinity nicotinic acid transporter [Vermiconidia calcicola]KAK5195193.1 High-affinity nicotinic acid transporter [Exophiala xenobiotica]KAK5209779.1 High-affinity nicotinic acid transporter [Exophiala xenobiotica]
MRFSIDGSNEKKGNAYNDSNGLGDGHANYDPDLAHPAAGYGDGEVATLPPGVSERKLITKIDLRVIPVLSVLYLLAFIDRTNVANAAIFGLQKDLGLSSTQYSTALTIFFVPYVLAEIPSNVILKRLKPHVWLSACMFMFGVVTICQGLVQGYGGFLTTRFFLGLFEAGMFPGSFYLISMWYKRHEAQKRYTFFFASTTLAGAFGGLLASAIGKMNHLRGYLGWRWVFILEGVLTCVVSFVWFFIITDFPEDAKWLTEAEREFVKARLRVDQGKSAIDRRITFKDIVNCFKDYKFIFGWLMYFGLIVPAYGYAYFAPTIIKSYGYGNIQTQLHSVPPWACAFGFSMLVAILSDRFRHRFLFAMIPICIAITGFAILMNVHHDTHTEYAALFLITSGTYSAMPIIVCWFTMNLGGHHRRSVGSAWQIGAGNIGGIIASYSFAATDAKTFFHKGYSICISFICLSAVSCICYFLACVSQNRSRAKSQDVGLTEYEKTELGDMSPDYRYML